jgi:hypothetical protein
MYCHSYTCVCQSSVNICHNGHVNAGQSHTFLVTFKLPYALCHLPFAARFTVFRSDRKNDKVREFTIKGEATYEVICRHIEGYYTDLKREPYQV